MKLPQIENTWAKKTGLPTNQNDRAGYPWQPESSLRRYLNLRHQHNNDVCINLIDRLNIRYPWYTKQEIEELYD